MTTDRLTPRALTPWLLAALLAGCTTTTPPPSDVYDSPAAAPAAPARPVIATRLPRVMFMIDEQNLGSIATADAEAVGASLLLERKVPIVDQEMVRSNIKKDQQLLKAAGDNKGAAAAGLQFGAEIVIAGEAVAKPSARRIADSNLRTYQATVTTRAVRTDTSETLASASETASIVALDDVAGGTQALKTAAKKTFELLIPKLLTEWEARGGGAASEFPHAITLSVGGVDQAWKLKALRDRLRGLTETIANLEQRSFTTGMAVFSLDCAIPAEDLAEKLILEAPKGLKLQMLDVGKGRIQMRAAATQQP